MVKGTCLAAHPYHV
jgi:hypothetical protein